MRRLEQITLKKKDRLAIEEAVSVLKKSFPIAAVRLFGSKARGDDDLESDIDLLILTARELSWRERNAMTDAVFDIQLKYGCVISLLVVPEEKWSRGIFVAHPIHEVIEEEGVAA